MSNNLSVKKRSGSIVQFDRSKITRAITKAFIEYLGTSDTISTYDSIIMSLTESVINIVRGKYGSQPIDIEKIQDVVELQLMSQNYHEVARLYIRYREHRKNLRNIRLKPDNNAVVDFVHLTKYARYQPSLKRRELYNETVERVRRMHLARLPQIAAEINWAMDMVLQRRILPSMRSMQYAGEAVEANHARIYNCCSSLCNRIRFFQEAFFLLLSGVGVGYSIQRTHTDQLPPIARTINTDHVVHHSVDDTIEGWADALGKLLWAYEKGKYVEFNYSRIRARGSPLKTSGGRAPGHLPLKKALDNIRNILDNALGRKLRPIECHDIMCFMADAVLSGGNRESAMIALFDYDDLEMINAKTGDWYKTNPHRQRANNSAVILRGEVTKSQFLRFFERTKQWGEPGFFFSDDQDITTNPCCEISKKAIYTVVDEADAARIHKRYNTRVKPGQRLYGWQMCNLTEQNAALFKTEEDFYIASRAATILGTVQASYTDFQYLGWVSEEITRREALLGVSMTGVMDSPSIALDPEIQKKAAAICVSTNIEIAAKIGINPAARITCGKPAGSTSIELGLVANGFHGHHAKRYFRRLKANKLSAVYQLFKSINPHMVEPYNSTTDYIILCVEAPEGAVIKDDLPAIEFLKKILSSQLNWVVPGTARPESTPGACHNISNTVTVKPDEWDETAEFIWKHKQYLTGVSLLSHTGDKDYKQAPYEAIVTPQDEAKWNYLISNYKPVDYSKMVEEEDNTELSGEVACSGGACLRS